MTKDNFGAARVSTNNKEREGRRSRSLSSQRSSHPSRWRAAKRSVATKLALCSLIGAVLFLMVPTASQAGPVAATLILNSEVFPGNTPLSGGVSGTIPGTAGSKVTLTAPGFIHEPAPTPSSSTTTATAPSLPTVYEFVFWDVNATAFTAAKAVFRVPSAGGPFFATAWYLEVCILGVTTTTGCGGGGPTLRTWVFSLTEQHVLPGTPISSVSPASDQTSPTSVSTATPPVKVTALTFFGVLNKFVQTRFISWFAFGAPSGVLISGLSLQVNDAESVDAVAFYKTFTETTPPPTTPKV
jgi:hypothetical protein